MNKFEIIIDNGKIIVPTAVLCEMYAVKKQTISGWRKKGLAEYDVPDEKAQKC